MAAATAPFLYVKPITDCHITCENSQLEMKSIIQKKKKKIHERPSASPDVKWLEQDFKHRPMQHFMTENNSNQDFTSFRNPSSIHKQVNTSKKGFFQKIIELCPL